MTMRPQLASSPATAVFTSGEFATDMAMRCADLAETAPVTSTRISFCAPSPSRTTWSARSSISSCKARAKSRRRRGSPSVGTRGCFAWPVAKSIKRALDPNNVMNPGKQMLDEAYE